MSEAIVIDLTKETQEESDFYDLLALDEKVAIDLVENFLKSNDIIDIDTFNKRVLELLTFQSITTNQRVIIYAYIKGMREGRRNLILTNSIKRQLLEEMMEQYLDDAPLPEVEKEESEYQK